jgi:hypothetical protein
MGSTEKDNLAAVDGWEIAYFTFMDELARKNTSRYELQAQELVKNHELKLTVNKVCIQYTLKRVGCWFSVSEDAGVTFRKSAWNRFGWRKSEKLRHLPNFFAKTEADILFQD